MAEFTETVEALLLTDSVYVARVESFYFKMPKWRNWQTHTTQNRAGNHAGSSPASGTKIADIKYLLFFILRNYIDRDLKKD